MLRISKQRGYKSFVLTVIRECDRVALFWGRFITMWVHILMMSRRQENGCVQRSGAEGPERFGRRKTERRVAGSCSEASAMIRGDDL